MGVLDSFRLDGRVALVTGASRGLGQAMSLVLAEAGADIVAVGRNAEDYAPLTSQIEALGRRMMFLPANLISASAKELQILVDTAIKKMGRLDILVNNAGDARRGPALEFAEADWDDILQLNLRAGFFLAQAVAPHMRENSGGKIINIASLLSFQGGWRVVSYAASKHAVLGMTRALANEWAEYGINVNAIVPGYFSTDLTETLRNDNQRNQEILRRIPAKRWGQPAELQGAVIFLASSASDYMHGSFVVIDGGWLAH
jgi:2-deoxy-D-gluconate 3-dehydrogenase